MNECVICFEEGAYLIECDTCNGAYLHKECQLQMNNNKCPLCRGNLQDGRPGYILSLFYIILILAFAYANGYWIVYLLMTFFIDFDFIKMGKVVILEFIRILIGMIIVSILVFIYNRVKKYLSN